jgi:hypothetical protein
MNMPRLAGWLSLAMLVMVAGSADANANWWWDYGYPGFPQHGVFSTYTNGRPPFYAEFPPVYYSHPEYRPYGLYPFAYTFVPRLTPSGSATVHPMPAPDAKRSRPQPEQTATAQSAPQVIYNPFAIAGADGAPKHAVAASGSPAPRVVFPAQEYGRR